MFVKVFIVSLLLCSIVVFQGCSSGTYGESASSVSSVVKSPADTREFKALTLPNNMEVILVRDKNSDSAAVSLALPVGLYQDPSQQQGLAHYLEHMLCQATEKFPEQNGFDKYIRGAGGYRQFSTGSTRTFYRFSISANLFEGALERFSECFKSPLLKKEYADKERNAVNSEWSMRRTDDRKIMNRIDFSTANPDHPGRQLGVGNFETLSDKPGSVLHEELVSFYQRYYSANIMKLVVVSQFPLNKQEALVRKHFGAVVDKGIERPVVTVPAHTDKTTSKKIFYSPVKDRNMLSIQFSVTDNLHAWAHHPNWYLESMLESKDPGTLVYKLRQQRLISKLWVVDNPRRYGASGRFDINITLTEDGVAKRDEVIASVYRYLNLIRQEGVNEKYYRHIKIQAEKRFAKYKSTSPLKTAVSMSLSMLSYPSKWSLAYPYNYKSFDSSPIISVLDQLKLEDARIWFIGKGESVDTAVPYFEGQYSTEDFSKEDLRRWKNLSQSVVFSLPEIDDTAVSSRQVIPPTIIGSPELIRNEPGLEVWLGHSENHQSKNGEFGAVVNSSFGGKVKNKSLLSKLFIATLKDQLFATGDVLELSDSKAKVIWKNGEFSIRLSGNSIDQASVMRQIMQHLSAWSLTEQEFNRAKSKVTRKLKNREKEIPVKQALRLVTKNPQKEGEAQEEIAKLDSISIEQLLDFKSRLFAENHIRILAFGNYDEKSANAIVDELIQALPADRVKANERYQKEGFEPEKGEVINHRKRVKSHSDNAIVDYLVLPEKNDKARAEMEVLAALMQPAFFLKLRTNEQLGYVARVFSKTSNEHPGLVFAIESDHAQLQYLKTRIENFRRNFFPELESQTDEDIKRVANSLAAKFSSKPKSFKKEVSLYFRDFHGGNIQFDSRKKFTEALKGVDRKNLIDLYRRVVLGEERARVLVQVKGRGFEQADFALIDSK